MQQAQPPEALFEAELNRKRQDSAESVSRFEQARGSAENYLSYFPPERQQRILLGALANIYLDEDKTKSDAVAWLAGGKDSHWFPNSSIAQQTIQAIRTQLLNNEN